MEAWGFTTGNFQVPSEEEIASLLQNIGSDLLSYDPGSGNLSLGEAKGIDFGGIAKGYTSGKIMEIFEEYGLSAGVVSLGGNVHCFRTKPDGSLWRCGIQDPLDPEALMGVVELSDRAAVTSGAYERSFVDEETGKTYHHILDPESGYPAQSGVLSVTIISDNGMLADGLSTALYVGGLSEAVSYWQKYDDEFDFIIMTERGEVYVTENLQNCFITDYPVMTVHQKDET